MAYPPAPVHVLPMQVILDFKPTPGMVKFAEAMLNDHKDELRTITAVCKRAQVTKQAYFKWRTQYEGFQMWLASQFAMLTPLVAKSIAHAAINPEANINLPAVKLHLALFNGWTEKAVIEHQLTGAQVAVVEDITTDLTAARALQLTYREMETESEASDVIDTDMIEVPD